MANIKDLKKKVKSTKGTFKITKAMKLVSASKLNRAQTFAFGQHSPQMEDSPTGRCRNDRADRLLSSPFAESPVPNRTPGRRMLSY